MQLAKYIFYALVNVPDNWTLQDDGNFVCKICGIPVNNVIGMKAHEDGNIFTAL